MVEEGRYIHASELCQKDPGSCGRAGRARVAGELLEPASERDLTEW